MRILILIIITFSYIPSLFAAQCGGLSQRPCTILERVPSCDKGLVENFATGRCEKSVSLNCGGSNQPACKVWERLPSCNKGLVEIRGICLQKGQCGRRGQRPCEIGERIPSCDRNLKENFKRNVCEPLRPGETPFLGGLSSLSEYYGDSIKTVCKQVLGEIDLNDNTPIGVGAECSKNVFVGAGCEYLASALGADTVATIGGIADTPRQIADTKRQMDVFKRKVDQAYASSPCNQFAEKVMKASYHARSNRGRCPDGQFWDPNGNCYSCPTGYTRTLEAVTSSRACVDKPAGELTRSACSVFIAATEEFAQSAACTAEVLSSGAFMNTTVGFEETSRDFCLATGELTYALTSILIPSKTAEQKAKQVTSSLDEFIQTIRRSYKKVDAIKSKFDKAKTVFDKGSNMAIKFRNLVNCGNETNTPADLAVSTPRLTEQSAPGGRDIAVIWQHNNGQVHYWPLRNGRRVDGINIHSPVAREWNLKGVGDVNGDGTDDIVWQHNKGQVHYWPLRNGRRRDGINVHSPVTREWSLKGVGKI